MGIGWRAVVVGFVVSPVSGWLFVILAVHPALHPQVPSSSSGYGLVVPLAYLVMVVDEAEIFLALLAAHFVGGIVAGMFSFWAVAFSLFFVLALLAGHLGGRLGGRLRRQTFGENSPLGGSITATWVR